MKTLLLASLLLLPAISARAYEPAAKSSFSQGDIKRNPFWPIGFVPGPPGVQSGPKIIIRPEDFHISSILAGTPSIAIINGKDYEVGQQISYDAGGTRIPLTVVRISDGVVTLGYKTKTFDIRMGGNRPSFIKP